MKLDYKNITINYTISGKGSTVVLLHGFLETIDMWNDFIPELSENHQVICIDLLGHGQTNCLGYVHTMEIMADAVFAVLTHHNVEQADFISLHVPAQDDYVIGTKEFGIMKKGAGIVNAARGGVIDELALVEAIDKGMISNAALDVFENEPNPEIQLLMNKNLIHILKQF